MIHFLDPSVQQIFAQYQLYAHLLWTPLQAELNTNVSTATIIITAPIYAEPSNLPRRKCTLNLWGSTAAGDQEPSSQNVRERRICQETTDGTVLLGNPRGHNQVVIKRRKHAFFLPCLSVPSFCHQNQKPFLFLIIRLIIVEVLEILKKYYIRRKYHMSNLIDCFSLSNIWVYFSKHYHSHINGCI